MAAPSRLAQAQAALRNGQFDQAAGLLDAAVAAGDQPPLAAIGQLAGGLLRSGRIEAAERWARRGLEDFPRDAGLWQMLGVALRRARRLDEALDALETARGLAPGDASPLFNIANVHNDRGDGVRAEAAIAELLRSQPNDPQLHHMLGRARRHQGDLAGADAALEAALRLDDRFVEAWRDRAMLASEQQRHDEALAILAAARARLPAERRLIERQADLLVRAGRLDEARAFLEAELVAQLDAVWAHLQLSRILLDTDLAAALGHAERAVALAPADGNARVALAHAHHRAAQAGRPEHLQQAYETASALAAGRVPVEHAFVVRSILAQAGALEAAEAVGGFAELGRYWALNGQHAALLTQLSRVASPADRRELLHQHRLWAAPIERRAAAQPASRRPRGPAPRKIRVGFLSSDLRRHAVGHFAQTLFEHYDRERFALHAYSFHPNEPDPVQARIAGQIAAFRCMPGVSEHEAAAAIAEDGLDMLIELGSTTRWNFAQLMAYRPAPVQASWLGYPHSVGLAAIDHIILDPYLAPAAPDLLVETPLLMPSSWLALGPLAFRDDPPVGDGLPEARSGRITFGTANNPNKYTRPMVAAWARVLAETPGSRFLFLRPEAAAPAFRENMRRLFALGGVADERLEFEPILGGHMACYGRIDICLDTFPLTGGTTTCESLWMGAPVVSLRGEAVFERLSHSILSNVGLGDLSVETVDAYVARAVELAADRPRRAELRATLRDRMRASPLGRAEAFTRDYFELVARAVESAAPIPGNIPAAGPPAPA